MSEYHVSCGGAVHTVHVDGATLALHHHDVPDEDALSALASDTIAPACVEVYRTWRATLDRAQLQLNLGALSGASIAVDPVIAAHETMTRNFEASRAQLLARGAAVTGFERLHANSRLRVGLAFMPPELREALALTVAVHGADDGALAHDEPRALSRWVFTADAASHGLRHSLATRLTDDGETSHVDRIRGTYAISHGVPRGPSGVHEWPGHVLLSDDQATTALVAFTVSSPVQDEADIVAVVRHQPSAVAARYDGRPMHGEVHVPASWLRTVFVRGVSKDQLVLEILEESADHARMVVRAVRWEREGDELAARVRDAEVTSDSPGVWNLAWSDA